MKSEEKMREEFEAWLSSLKFVAGQGQDHVDYCLHRDLSDIYTVEWVRDMWRGWVASRESLVIRVNSAACHDATAGDVLDAIENSGIKWEVEQ